MKKPIHLKSTNGMETFPDSITRYRWVKRLISSINRHEPYGVSVRRRIHKVSSINKQSTFNRHFVFFLFPFQNTRKINIPASRVRQRGFRRWHFFVWFAIRLHSADFKQNGTVTDVTNIDDNTVTNEVLPVVFKLQSRATRRGFKVSFHRSSRYQVQSVITTMNH